MLGGAYSTQYKVLERQHVDTIKTLAENEKSDAIARAKKLSIETNRRRRTQYKVLERQHVDTIKTLAENEKSDAIARAKKLSIETNRRRRALAIKRKSEAEREEKRRQQILAKRREKQQEATEKFQRGHIQSRPGSGSSSGRWSPRRTNIHSQLEDALKIVRGSPISSRASSARTRNQPSPRSSLYRQNSDPLSKPYFNKYAHPSINNGNGLHTATTSQHTQEELHNKSLRNLNNSRNLFEQQLESYQQSLLEQQQKTLREFNKQIMKEIEMDKNVVNNEISGINELERSESLSTVDSLEDNNSNDTLRESCDLNAFMTQKNEDNYLNGAKNVTFADDRKEAIKIYGNNSQIIQSAVNTEPKNIDSYNAQIQALETPSQHSEENKQQFYFQRQKEIQQQLQEQQKQQLLLQQKQQQELQEKVLEQQQKQKQLLQQQFERQNQEELERQRQQDQKYLQQQAPVSSVAATFACTGSEEGKENQRPKAQMKAWTTPSPHPPTPASAVITTTTTFVTHASPYTGKNTHTNTTVPVVTSNGYSSKSNTPVSVNNQTVETKTYAASSASSQVSEKNIQANTDFNRSDNTIPALSVQDKSMSFLETVTFGLSTTPDSNSSNSTPTSVSKNQSNSNVSAAKNLQQVGKTNGNSSVSSKGVTTPSTPTKPLHAGYYNSYGAAYSARQQVTNGSNNTNKSVVGNTSNNVKPQVDAPKMNGEVTWALPEGLEGQFKMMTADTVVNGDDAADTDSVSTICDDREAEAKEVKSILKRTGSTKKTGGILKKSGSTGNMKEIRDSLEITRVHLQTSAEEKEQRMLREKERLSNPPPAPTKKNVRFADLCYDEEPEPGTGGGNDKLFTKRNSDVVTQKPPRPVSAVTTKTFSPKIDSKPPRASSATVRTSTIPRAKTQIVRPQAAAHIITQSTQNLENACFNEKVTVVNSNFMEKVPAMARANHTAPSVTPASVYAVTSVNYTQPQQKVNYAVSSIVMPKSESAPFIYPGYNKPGPVPAGSLNGPTQAGNNSKYDGAVYDDNGLRIDRTPTDEEINFLWDKLRNCLSRNSQATPDSGQTDGPSGGSRQAAPVAHTYIDGNALGQYNSLNRVAQQPGYSTPTNPGIRRQNSLDSANNTYTRRYGLLQQRKQQPNPNSLKSRQQQPQQQGYTVYQPPVQSQTEPQPSGPLSNGAEVTESMAGFLAAEQLADQSVSESKIHQAIDDAQARQHAYNSARPQPKVKSALSIEEQRLMESLDRLNDKLKTAEGTIENMNVQNETTTQPFPQQQRQQSIHRSSFLTADGKVSGFKGHSPITQRRVIEAGNHRARLRITSAHLKRNIHRHQ